MYESILEVVKQEIQSAMAAETVNFVQVRKLTEVALDLQESSVTSVVEMGTQGTPRMTRAPALGAGYGPTGTERMISEVLPQIASLLEGKFASDSLSSLSALLETYTKVSNPDAPGFDEELVAGVKDKLKKYLQEGKDEDIHTDEPRGHQPDA